MISVVGEHQRPPMAPSPGGAYAVRGEVREIEERLCGVLALVERHVRDALEEVGVVLEGADVAPGDLVRA